MAATGAMLAGRRTYEVGKRDAGETSGETYGGAWTGPQFVLTHQTPGNPHSVARVNPGRCRPQLARSLSNLGSCSPRWVALSKPSKSGMKPTA
jgi:hypothetical protein